MVTALHHDLMQEPGGGQLQPCRCASSIRGVHSPLKTAYHVFATYTYPHELHVAIVEIRGHLQGGGWVSGAASQFHYGVPNFTNSPPPRHLPSVLHQDQVPVLVQHAFCSTIFNPTSLGAATVLAHAPTPGIERSTPDRRAAAGVLVWQARAQ